MLTLPHTLVGLAIIKLIPHPVIGPMFAFVSHFIVDFCIPHWNPHIFTEISTKGKLSPHSKKIIFIDGLIALLICGYIALINLDNPSKIILYALGALAAVLPDLIELPYYFFNFKSRLLSRYIYFEHKYQANANIFWGNLTQVLLITAALKVLFF